MKQKAIPQIVPYIPSTTHLPEITLKAFILGVILSMLMASANAYLVLKVGISVSACIPAAIISMAVLKMFRNSNILENNIVQTAASAGEIIACALALIIPALIMIGYWESFNYLIMTSITVVGGLLGVLLSVPLRRAMVVESGLKFPEGVATAEVLKAGDESAAAKEILFAGISAALIKFCQSGFQILADSIHIWGRVGNTVAGVTAGFSFALMGAGYVVGLRATAAMFAGAIFSWFIGVPLYGAIFGLPVDATDAYSAAVGIWNSKIRIIGVGMMVFGGLWTTIELFDPIRRAIISSLDAVRKINPQDTMYIRTDSDIPITVVAFGALFLTIPIYLIFHNIFLASALQITIPMIIGITVVTTVLAFVLSALGSVISSYMCGLLGTTTNPISGILIVATLVISFALMLCLSPFVNFSTETETALNAAGITILIATLIGCATAIAGDNLQDLKSGQIVGSTPWKQQFMLVVGVLASAIILAPIFQILFEAYGIGEVLPHEGMDPTQALSAPKAALMAALSQAIFTQSMDWTMVTLGVCLGIIVILIDNFLKKIQSSWRLSILSVAVGIYMPLDVTTPLLIGGILAHASQKSLAKSRASASEKAATERRGILFASGLIAGEALVGILLAIPFVTYQDTNVFRIVPQALAESTDVLGLLVTLVILYWFYQVASKTKKG